MQVYITLGLIGIAAFGYACYFVFLATSKSITAVGTGVANTAKSLRDKRSERFARVEAELQANNDAARRAEIDAYRLHNPVQVGGLPSVETFCNAFLELDSFIAAADTFRPTLTSNLDGRFRKHEYPTHLFQLLRSYPDSLSAKPPQKIEITAADILMSVDSVRMIQFYEAANLPRSFPYDRPGFNDSCNPPRLRLIEIPARQTVVLLNANNAIVDDHMDFVRDAYKFEFEKAAALNLQVDRLYNQFREKREAASVAKDLMEINIANTRLKLRDAQQAYDVAKSKYVADGDAATQFIRDTHARYVEKTAEGIRQHFELTLRNLQMPLPSDFPWQCLYDPTERLLQIDQCVPSLKDIAVNRADSARPPAKRDAEAVLRRYVPSIALQISHHVAINDLNDDVERIAVNCWCSFYDPASGKLKDAFIATLAAGKIEIAELNLQNADALEAFRALRGAYVYNVNDVVPIEPLIRLDKDDERFVIGRDVLDGMAQGQNLADMDWQDFEHLIRELLAKEFADKNAEVKITRASRDRGVDAVIFNSDPLHGGKIIVQAKRYTNRVEVAAVRELFGTVHNEGANRGILVTTSHDGRDAHEFASNKPITLIDGPNLLQLLNKHGYKFKIGSVR